MHIIIKTFLTVFILLLLPLVLFQFLLGYGEDLNELKQVLMLLILPYGFAPLALGSIALSALHHSLLSAHKKRLYGFLTVAVIIALRIAMLFAWGDGSWGTLGMMIFGGVELFCLGCIGVLFWMMNGIPADKRDRTRIILFVLLLAVFILQTAGFLRPGLIE